MSDSFKYDKWYTPDDNMQKTIRRAYRFEGYGLLVGYIVLIVLFVAAVLYNVLFQEINIAYVIVFLVLTLATVAGLGNQVKTVRQIRDRKFEIRDGYVRKINYSNKMKRGITSYDIEISEKNVIKTIVVKKEYRRIRPKTDDHVYIVRSFKTSSIYIYKRFDNVEAE